MNLSLLLRRLLGRLLDRVHERSYALGDLDRKVARFLPMRGGVFVEAGANDGLAQSNTLFFERHRGWTGLLIEPIPELAAQCRRNRPRCVVENVALVPFGFATPTIEMQYCNLMSVVRGSFPSAEEETAHVARGSKIQGIATYSIRVPVAPLSVILDRNGYTHVDLLSLDVEGFELRVLQGIDFERHRPIHMLIEARFRNSIEEFLGQLYEPVAELSHHDVLYRCRDPLHSIMTSPAQH
jgi:FkbM family methyltransferase